MKSGPKPRTRVELFLCHVDKPANPDDCIPWRGAKLTSGYGIFSGTTAHRRAYELFVGDPGELVVDHLCRNRACVNVLHLEAVPQLENTLRGDKGRRRTHCHNGHPITPENTIIENDRHRRCRICKAEKQKRAHERFLREGRRRCADCGTAVGRRATRCLSCSAKERERGRRLFGVGASVKYP